MICDVELMSGIHGEFVDDGLPENAVVAVGIPPRLASAKASFLAEIAIGEPCTRAEYQGRGNHHNGHECIEHLYVDMLQHKDDGLVHPGIAVGRPVFPSIQREHPYC